MTSKCIHCGITGPARTSKCFPKDDKNNQRHEFIASDLSDDRKHGRLGYVCGMAIIYYGSLLILNSCILIEKTCFKEKENNKEKEKDD
jgi:hypothetical protein